MEVSPDLESLSDGELKALIHELTEQEREISYQRRLLHGRIELLKAELVKRLQGHEDSELGDVDVDELSRILAGRLPDVARLEGADERS